MFINFLNNQMFARLLIKHSDSYVFNAMMIEWCFKPKDQVSYCHHIAFVVCRPSVTFSKICYNLEKSAIS